MTTDPSYLAMLKAMKDRLHNEGERARKAGFPDVVKLCRQAAWAMHERVEREEKKRRATS